MKRLILFFVVLFITAALAQAEPAEVKCGSIYAATLGAGATANTDTLQTARRTGYEGYFSVQPIFTGTGVLKIDYQVSNNGTTWSQAVEIIASAVSGTVYPYPASGVNIFSGYQRLVLTETGSANPVVITGVYRCEQ